MASNVHELARQLQAEGPDEFPFGYYFYLAQLQIEERETPPDL